MAITQALAISFKSEILAGIHNFTAGTGDTFKMALYTSAATLSSATTIYSSVNEVVGTGYTAGGINLTSNGVATGSGVAYVDFADATWAASTITARGAMIYNSSKANRAVLILDFGADKTSTVGDFSVVFPTADATNAILRIA